MYNTPVIRPARESDLPEVLMLNEESVKYTAPMDLDLLRRLDGQSRAHLVAELDGRVVAFMLLMREGRDYDSINYIWFMEHYPRFLYVDRVVVSESCRGLHVGSALYERAFALAAADGLPVLTAEINIEPPNLPSLAFHRRFGFAEVGRHYAKDGSKLLSLQAAEIK